MSISSENGFRRDSKGVSSSELERLHHSYASKALNCHSTRGLGSPVCLRKGCYFCADLATIDELSTAYEHILDLLQRREEIIKKPNHDSLTDRVPLEILSLIFICVQEAYDDESDKPSYSQPCTSPALLVGAVCKKWRDITLRTPQLWTDIKVNLAKPMVGQFDMVNEWAIRSGALAVDLEVFVEQIWQSEGFVDEDNIVAGCGEVVQALRLLATRWNDVAIEVPWSVCHKLFNELEESPPIASFHLYFSDRLDTVLNPIKLRHPFRPRSFHSLKITQKEMPLEWDNLVYLAISDITDEQLLLIIRQAQNLRHCNVDSESLLGNTVLPAATTHVLNRSLIQFEFHTTSNWNIIRHLTLPSLQHLDYLIGGRTSSSSEQFNSLSDFITRSSPPLKIFSLDWDLMSGDPDPCFERFPQITSLSITTYGAASIDYDRLLHTLTKPSTKVILPRLEYLHFSLNSVPASFWPLFSRLFDKVDNPDLEDMEASVTLGRPYSVVNVYCDVSEDSGMDKETFLHLSAVRKSGVVLSLVNRKGGDLMGEMAKLYDTNLKV